MPSSPVRFNDVSASYQAQREEIDAAIAGVIQRGDFINGRDVQQFESEFAAYCGASHAVGTSNGTSALHLALAALEVGTGDEVITTPMTFIATSEAITHTGAHPVFADIDPGTLNLDPERVRAAITPRTRALIFVHLHGNPTGIQEIAALAKRHKLFLIEDCAQAHGARVPAAWLDEEKADLQSSAGQTDQIHVGRFGAAGCFSFFPAKNLGAFGDAGAVISDDAGLAARMQQLANHGREEKYRHLVEGYNYRLDTLQAAVLRVKLRKLDEQVARRNKLVRRYRECLTGLPLEFQQQAPGTWHALHLFVVESDFRDELQAFLRRRGIETGIHYPIPLHLQPAYRYLNCPEGTFPAAEAVARRSLSLPLYPQMPMEHVERTCEAVKEFFAGNGG